MTDFADFEKLASEVMYLDGWSDIKPLGGVADLGQDAVSDRFFRQSGDVEHTVFQYTLQEYMPGKISVTIKKLRENKIKFTELVVVTPHEISSESQLKMKRGARATYKVTLTIYERKTLSNRLADLENGLFNRHFANIKAQLDDVTRAASKGVMPEGALERSLLQVSLALTFRPDTQRARKNVFDHFVLAVALAQSKPWVPITELIAKCTAAVKSKKIIPAAQMDAALGRMEKAGLVQLLNERVSATEKAFAEIATATVRLNEATTSFASDIVNDIRDALKTRLSDEVERRIVRNTRAVLVEIARSRGVVDNPAQVDKTVAALAREQMPQNIGEALIAALAEVLRSPTEDQARTMARCTQAYMAFVIMGLDPTLNAFQTSRFRNKIFILDTDVVIEALVDDGPRSPGLRAIFASLVQMGCRLIIPESVLRECIEHASNSPNTYGYFGLALLDLTPSLVEERVWNAFVKGYYYARVAGRISGSVGYEEYLANYYEPRNPLQFIQNVLKQVLPEEIEVLPLEAIASEQLGKEEVARFAERLKQDLAGSKKSRYRSEEDEAKLAEIDAQLFLTALHLNPSDESTETDVLGGTCYLVTEAARYSRVAANLGVHTKVTVRPGALAGVQELVGTFDLSPIDFLQLFDNPLLETAIDAAWPDMEKLVRSGISLRGKSLPRLRFDLDDAIHNHLTALSSAEAAEETDGIKTHGADEEFMNLLDTAASRGYSMIPELETVRERINTSERRAGLLQTLLDNETRRNQELDENIAFFGKRRQRYLRRMNKSRGQGS
jgi:hypothetical protein